MKKFRILSNKIIVKLSRVSAVLTACARLYNFIIQHDGLCGELTICMNVSQEERFLQIRPNNTAPLGMSYLPFVPDEMYVFETEEGDSQTHAEIEDFLRNSLHRPVHIF